MTDTLTYYAALKLLEKPRSRLVSLLDSVPVKGSTAQISILALRDEIVGFAQEVVRDVPKWRQACLGSLALNC